MKISFYLYIIIALLNSCNKVNDLKLVGKHKKLNSSIDLFIEQISRNDEKKAISIFGNDENGKIDITIINDRPTIYSDEIAKKIFNQENTKYGYFSYKGYDVFVSSELQNCFDLKYLSINDAFFKGKLNEKEIPIISDPIEMWIEFEPQKNALSYRIPSAGENWKKIE